MPGAIIIWKASRHTEKVRARSRRRLFLLARRVHHDISIGLSHIFIAQGCVAMFHRIRKWWQFILLHLRVRKIASSAMSDSWPKVRIKVAGLPTLAANEYVGRHSAAVVHRRVELLVRQNPAIDAGAAN